MTRLDAVLQVLERINARDFDAVRDLHTSSARFFAPGLDLDLHGRDAILDEITRAVRQGDLRYEVQDAFEQGPFVVVFARSTGYIDGYPMGWDLCAVYRFDDDKVAETWVMRGSPPQPLT
jgi:ketosteroid isomerase-like protein